MCIRDRSCEAHRTRRASAEASPRAALVAHSGTGQAMASVAPGSVAAGRGSDRLRPAASLR
eukprot:6571329-Alexandrium_andersonii.AAC.1